MTTMLHVCSLYLSLSLLKIIKYKAYFDPFHHIDDHVEQTVQTGLSGMLLSASHAVLRALGRLEIASRWRSLGWPSRCIISVVAG